MFCYDGNYIHSEVSSTQRIGFKCTVEMYIKIYAFHAIIVSLY